MIGKYREVIGTPYKMPCKVAVSGNLILAAPVTSLDGVSIYTGDRVLLFGQTVGSENGIYVLNSFSRLERAIDFTYTDDAYSGILVLINFGTYALKTFRLSTADPIILGTTTINFAIYSTGSGTSGGGTGTSGTSGTTGTSGSAGSSGSSGPIGPTGPPGTSGASGSSGSSGYGNPPIMMMYSTLDI